MTTNTVKAHTDILSAATKRETSAHFTPPGDSEEQCIKLDNTGIDSGLLVTLNDLTRSPRIVVTLLEAPILMNYSLPIFLRNVYGTHDRLTEVRLTVIHGSKISTDKGTARDGHGTLYQCIEVYHALLGCVVSQGEGKPSSIFEITSNAKVYLPSGQIRLS